MRNDFPIMITISPNAQSTRTGRTPVRPAKRIPIAPPQKVAAPPRILITGGFKNPPLRHLRKILPISLQHLSSELVGAASLGGPTIEFLNNHPTSLYGPPPTAAHRHTQRFPNIFFVSPDAPTPVRAGRVVAEPASPRVPAGRERSDARFAPPFPIGQRPGGAPNAARLTNYDAAFQKGCGSAAYSNFGLQKEAAPCRLTPFFTPEYMCQKSHSL